MKKYIVLFSLLASALFSCEKVVDVDVPFEDPKLVINGFLNPDSLIAVQLSKSKFILDGGDLKNITDARVSIYEGEKKLGDLQHKAEGLYVLPAQKPQSGKTYTIRAEHESFEPVSATEQVLSRINLLNAKVAKVEVQNQWYSEKYRFDFRLSDPAGEKNYYLLKAFEKRTVRYMHWNEEEEEEVEYVHWNNLRLESPDPNMEEVCHWNCDLLFSDTFFDGKIYEAQASAVSYSYWGDNDRSESEIFLAVYHISEAAYLYYKTLAHSYNASGDPFAEPVRVYTNIKGGYGAWISVSGSMIKAEF